MVVARAAPLTHAAHRARTDTRRIAGAGEPVRAPRIRIRAGRAGVRRPRAGRRDGGLFWLPAERSLFMDRPERLIWPRVRCIVFGRGVFNVRAHPHFCIPRYSLPNCAYCARLGVSAFHWVLFACNLSLNFFGTDCAQAFNFPSCPNVRNTHGSVGNTSSTVVFTHRRPQGQSNAPRPNRTLGQIIKQLQPVLQVIFIVL
eukprot:COSAG02_NODE_7829_length_2831_cov_1.499268_2_plen_200_part_00